MSGAYFQHTCPVTHTSTQRITRWTCKKCGQRALFAGCRSSMVESWWAYRRRTGIAGFGPHRGFADQLLKEIDPGPCPACAGRGAIDPDADDYPLSCQSCDGSGRAPYAPAELARVQAQVQAEWPPERIADGAAEACQRGFHPEVRPQRRPARSSSRPCTSWLSCPSCCSCCSCWGWCRAWRTPRDDGASTGINELVHSNELAINEREVTYEAHPSHRRIRFFAVQPGRSLRADAATGPADV